MFNFYILNFPILRRLVGGSFLFEDKHEMCSFPKAESV